MQNEAFTETFTRLFEAVGEEYSEDKLKEPGWYAAHEWSVEQEQEFATWFERRLRSNKFARQLYGYAMKDNYQRKRCTEWFILNYGWKQKEVE